MAHTLLASVWYAEGAFAHALDELLLAEQVNPLDPALHCRIGEVYLRLRNWAEAERAFSHALRLDADSARAHHGLAVAALEQGRYDAAARAALQAIGLRYRFPIAHYHLGVALAQLGDAEDAARAFETCLLQQPRLAAAHGWLAELYGSRLDDASKAAYHRALSQARPPITLHHGRLDVQAGEA
jgi:tetratricopeptide (TPR) repeat protein